MNGHDCSRHRCGKITFWQTTPQRRHSTWSRPSANGSRCRITPIAFSLPARFAGAPSAVEPRLLKVELAAHRAHRIVTDDSLPPQLVDGLPLGLAQHVQQLLVGGLLLLDGAVPLARVLLREPVAPERGEAAQPLGGLVAPPVLLDQLIDPGE